MTPLLAGVATSIGQFAGTNVDDVVVFALSDWRKSPIGRAVLFGVS